LAGLPFLLAFPLLSACFLLQLGGGMPSSFFPFLTVLEFKRKPFPFPLSHVGSAFDLPRPTHGTLLVGEVHFAFLDGKTCLPSAALEGFEDDYLFPVRPKTALLLDPPNA